jgi:hypothetical protein
MAHTCSRCSRVNPADAVYCYYDGFALGNGSGGPALAGGQRHFPNPFVFPSGRTCRNFDELAMACQDCWSEACDLLQQGFLESFLGGMGRMDLALAAKDAARFPDRQRGLDQLLDKIPSNVLDEPMLRVDPQEINLGVVTMGADRTFELNLENQGMRLIYGTISSDNCAWITLGEGAHEKTFELTHDFTVPVKIRGDRLRAGPKPLEGRILIESNAGAFAVIVRAQVPVKPFAGGLLAGANSPRQVAEKARANPKDAAVLFEQGVVAKWYKENGWVYPVQAPSSSGLAAVQQFFEALGLTPPPKVDVNKRLIRLHAEAGDSLRETIEVTTSEKRPVWAHATSDSPWIEVGRARLNGRMATIPLGIPSVPNRPGEKITAKITITSNGNQRFVVPIEIDVGNSFEIQLAPAVAPPVERNGGAAIVPERQPVTSPIVAQPDEFTTGPSIGASSYQRRRGSGGAGFLHFVPAAVLAVLVLGLVIFDFVVNRPRSDNEGQTFTDNGRGGFNIPDTDPLIQIGYNIDTHRFGIVDLTGKDPTPGSETPYKRLTYNPYGGQNNTVVKINGEDFVFGQIVKDMKGFKKNDKQPTSWTVQMRCGAHKVYVTQTVMLVPGDNRQLDTCLVHYTIENSQDLPAKVGLRAMIDTYIGSNDGVPFSVPGHNPPLVADLAILDKGKVPDYIQALEFPDLADPGTIAHIGLKGFRLPDVDHLEEPDKVVLCRWPHDFGGRDARWDWEFESIHKDPNNPDSCIVVYWPYIQMRGHEKRDMAFTYGLSGISSDLGDGKKKGPQLGIFANRGVRPGDVFTVTGFVKNPLPNKPVRLELPDGLSLVSDAEQMPEAKGDMSQVSWKVKAEKTGKYKLEVTHGESSVKRDLEVSPKKSIFD